MSYRNNAPLQQNNGGFQTARGSAYVPEIPDITDNFPKPKAPVKRSFSWGKKKRAAAVEQAKPVALSEEARLVTLDRYQADVEVGFEQHTVTGDIFVSHVGPTIKKEQMLEVGECILAIKGVPLEGGDADTLDFARYLLREPAATCELIVQRHTVRREVLKRVAALRGTSLDKLGLTLAQEKVDDKDQGKIEHIIVSELAGLALKSRRIALGDRVIAINGMRFQGLGGAVDLLAEDIDEVTFDLVYGYEIPDNHEFDAESGVYVMKAVVEEAPVSGLQKVRRSLSFGKKTRKSTSGTAKAPSAASTSDNASGSGGIPDLYTHPRRLTVRKNADGMIMVTFKAHAVTGEMIVGLVASESPALQAGVEVGDRILEVQGRPIHGFGEEGLDEARDILASTAHLKQVELLVQTCIRSETLSFAAKEPGAPKNYLGLGFYSFSDDQAVRVTNVNGPAAKSGRIALGDRIVSVNGIRVNHAKTLSEHIAHFAAVDNDINFEIALGYSPAEGLWYEDGNEDSGGGGIIRKVKRSFSFGRKPKH